MVSYDMLFVRQFLSHGLAWHFRLGIPQKFDLGNCTVFYDRYIIINFDIYHNEIQIFKSTTF